MDMTFSVTCTNLHTQLTILVVRLMRNVVNLWVSKCSGVGFMVLQVN